MKNTADATNMDTSMPRVKVHPINTPSHIKAATPATGSTSA